MIRKALTPTQRSATRNPTAAAAVIEGLNEKVSEQKEQIKLLEANLTDIQDRYSALDEKYHKTDKKNGILTAINTYSVGFEVMKYLISAVGTSVGVNLGTDGYWYGWLIIALTAVGYILVTRWQVSANNKATSDQITP